MALQPIPPVAGTRPSRETGGVRQDGAAPAPTAAPAAAQDALELSRKAQEALDAARRKEPLPRFGRFQLGGPEPLAFGPSQNASALTKIPEDGYRKPAEGVDVGHQPVRGLNLLA